MRVADFRVIRPEGLFPLGENQEEGEGERERERERERGIRTEFSELRKHNATADSDMYD